ncbi:MAG: hypothetical protein IT350_09260 [Deltaproteobacteria bacterium]|nr:hypothetical protein [Deltaproteobacteria bacterium]
MIEDRIPLFIRDCNPYETIDPTDRRWVDLDKNGVRGDISSTDELLAKVLEADKAGENASILFSGFSGGGKSTILRQVRNRLIEEKFDVLLIDSEDFFSLDMPVETYEVLLTIAGALDERIEWPDKEKQGWWSRWANFLTSNVVVANVKFNVPLVGEFQGEIKKNPEWREALQEMIERQQKQRPIVELCRGFISEAIAAWRDQHRGRRGLAIIFDSLEKLRGSEASKIRKSIVNVFHRFGPDLNLPCHTIYSIPPWLRFTKTWNTINGRFSAFVQLSMIMVSKKEQNREALEKGMGRIRALIETRVPIRDIWGDMAHRHLDDLAATCGGYPRDALLLIRNVLSDWRSVIYPDLAPEPRLARIFDRAFAQLCEQYDTSLWKPDGEMLSAIEDSFDVPLGDEPGVTGESEDSLDDRRIARLAELFDNHFVICYRNGGGSWCDVHPILRKRSDRYQRIKAELRARHGG